MGQILNNNFSAGYCPSDNYLNGRPNGQLRMDNLCLDENGALVLSKAPVSISNVTAGQQLFSVYSKYLAGKRYRFLQKGDWTIWVDLDGSGNYATLVCSGGYGPKPAAYGSGFGRIFVSNGADNKEFDGTSITPWGFKSQTLEPILDPLMAVCCPFYGPEGNSNFNKFYIAFEGTITSQQDGIVNFNTAPNNKAVVRYSTVTHLNLNDFVNSGDVGASGDIFYLCIYSQIIGQISSLEVRAQAHPTDDTLDYYTHTWPASAFAQNYNNWSLLQCTRDQFTKNGTVDWSNIAATEVILNSVSIGNFIISQPYEFYNTNNSYANINAGLDRSAPVVYYQQNLTHLEGTSGRSPLGPPSRPIFGKYSAVGIIPRNPNDPGNRVFEMDIYRTGGQLSGGYYWIGSKPIPEPVWNIWDFNTDVELLAQGDSSDELTYLAAMPTGIRAIEGPVNGRMIYMTDSNVQFSDFMNPEAIDDRLTIQPSNSADESCLFITKTSNAVMILATTQDFYEISGTFAELDGGVFDIVSRAAGIKQPAVSRAFAIYDNAILYIAARSVRRYGFSQTDPMTQELAPLFNGETKHGINGFYSGPWDTDYWGLRWAIVYSKYKLYFRVTHVDNISMSTFVYDTIRQIWYHRTDTGPGKNCIPLYFHAEEDGGILTACGDGSIRLYEQDYKIDGTTNQVIYYESICHTTQNPFARKDLYTLKIWMATNGDSVRLTLQDETKNQYVIADSLSTPSTEIQQLFVKVHGISIDLSQRYSLIITDINGIGVNYFKMTNWSMDFGERPDRELFLNILPSNFGSPSRKRIRTLPMVIDTFGQVTTFQPNVDNQNVEVPTAFVTNGKQTVYHLFQEDQFGVDYGGTLTAASSSYPFEFYGLMNPVSVEELPPPKLFDQVGPFALDKKGKIYGFRVRMVSFTDYISYVIYLDDVVAIKDQFTTTPNVDTTYEVLRVPPGLIGNVVRIEFSSPSATKPFMRWYVQLRYVTWGMGTDEKWATIAGKVGPTE